MEISLTTFFNMFQLQGPKEYKVQKGAEKEREVNKN